MKVVPWERGRFWVTSETRRTEYLVDLLENRRRGWCDCPDHRIRVQPKFDAGLTPRRRQCKHIEAVRQWLIRLAARQCGFKLNKREQRFVVEKLVFDLAKYEHPETK